MNTWPKLKATNLAKILDFTEILGNLENKENWNQNSREKEDIKKLHFPNLSIKNNRLITQQEENSKNISVNLIVKKKIKIKISSLRILKKIKMIYKIKSNRDIYSKNGILEVCLQMKKKF